MKPSSKNDWLGVTIGAALAVVAPVFVAPMLTAGMPAAAMAAPAGRMFTPVLRGARSAGVHPSRQGRAVGGHQGGFRHRPPDPALSGFTWPQYWSGPLPASAPYPYPAWPDFADAPAPVPSWFGPPPVAACREPLVIKVSKTRPARHLPRVVYGTPSACQD